MLRITMNLQKKFYYIYKITNLINQKIYIGAHSTNDINDGYMGSGKGIKCAISKYGIANFQKEILEYFDNVDSMFLKEKEIVNEQFVKNKNTYNDVVGGNKPPVGRRKGIPASEETKQKIREARAKQITTDETRRKMSESRKGEKHWTYGKPRSEETKQKLREANLGKVLSEETKQKMRGPRLKLKEIE